MEETKQKNEKKEDWFKEALIMFSRLSIWVALPVVSASLLGQWLDKVYGTKPWILIVCIAFAFNITIIFLIKETAKVFKKIDDNIAENDKETKEDK